MWDRIKWKNLPKKTSISHERDKMRKKLSRTEMVGGPTTRVLRLLAISLQFKNVIAQKFAALNRQAVRHLTIVSALLLKYANLVITKSIKITEKLNNRECTL